MVWLTARPRPFSKPDSIVNWVPISSSVPLLDTIHSSEQSEACFNPGHVEQHVFGPLDKDDFHDQGITSWC